MFLFCGGVVAAACCQRLETGYATRAIDVVPPLLPATDFHFFLVAARYAFGVACFFDTLFLPPL